MKMKYAVVRIGGSQYFVSEGDELVVDKLPSKEGERIELTEILLLVDEKKVLIGEPVVEKSKISAKILKQFKGEKIRVSKFKAKTGYRRVTGFRPQLTLLKIEKID